MMAAATPQLHIIRGLPSFTTEAATHDSLGRVRGRLIFRLDLGDGQENPFDSAAVGESPVSSEPIPGGLIDALQWKLGKKDSREVFDTETVHSLDFLSSGPMFEVEYPSTPPLKSLPALFAAIADNTSCERTRSDAAFGWVHATIAADDASFSKLPIEKQRETLLELGGYIARTNLRKFEESTIRGIAHAEGAKRGVEAAKQSKVARQSLRNKAFDLQRRIDAVWERDPDLSHRQASMRVTRELKGRGIIIDARTVQRNTVQTVATKSPTVKRGQGESVMRRRD